MQADLRNEGHWSGREFNPTTTNDIGAGAVFGIDEFYVMGKHDYYYEVGLFDWVPTPETTESFKAIAKAIAAADS